MNTAAPQKPERNRMLQLLLRECRRLEGYACECYRETHALYAELVEPLL